MKVYHCTDAADAILQEGFRDPSGGVSIGGLELLGVWVSDCPLGCQEGARGEDYLILEIPAEVLCEHELIQDSGYREFVLPAALINTFPVQRWECPDSPLCMVRLPDGNLCARGYHSFDKSRSLPLCEAHRLTEITLDHERHIWKELAAPPPQPLCEAHHGWKPTASGQSPVPEAGPLLSPPVSPLTRLPCLPEENSVSLFP